VFYLRTIILVSGAKARERDLVIRAEAQQVVVDEFTALN